MMVLPRFLRRLLRRLAGPLREALDALDDPGARRDCPGHACAGETPDEKSIPPGTSR